MKIRRTSPSAVFVSLLLGSAWSGNAHAARAWSADFGAYLSYDFGGRRPGHFGFGLELRGMYAQTQFNCGLRAARYTGVAARVSILGWDQVRVVVAPQLGVTISLPYPYPPDTASIGGELGLGYRLKRDPGWFLQPGIEGNFANVPFLRVDRAFSRDSETRSNTQSGSMDLGARLGPAGSHALSGASCD